MLGSPTSGCVGTAPASSLSPGMPKKLKERDEKKIFHVFWGGDPIWEFLAEPLQHSGAVAGAVTGLSLAGVRGAQASQAHPKVPRRDCRSRREP